MHAIRQHAFGPPETLAYEDVPDPVPAPDQVRIAVEAAGVHLIDTSIRRGEAGGPYPLPDLPMTPGREVAGAVDRVGSGAPETWLGRRVVAHLGPASGGYATLAVAPVAALHPVPDGLAPDVAVAMIGTGRTAMGILEVADLTAKDAVLVTAAAGGLGTLLVQAARAAGAAVVGLAGGPAKVERVRANGATGAVDYRVPGWPDAVGAALGDRARGGRRAARTRRAAVPAGRGGRGPRRAGGPGDDRQGRARALSRRRPPDRPTTVRSARARREGYAGRGAAASTAAATRNIVASPSAGAMTCTPTGRPSSPAPNGTDTAGWPARLDGIVHTSLRYIVNGSAVLAPSGNAVEGAVGLSSTSKSW